MEELFSSARITTFLKSHAKNIEVEIVEETKSTNTDLLRRIHNLQAPTLLLALKQTEGRGRGGKAWHSAFGSSLTFSLQRRMSLRKISENVCPVSTAVPADLRVVTIMRRLWQQAG